MVLETPNRLVAAANVLVDPFAAAPEDVYSYRSNNGFRSAVNVSDPSSVNNALLNGFNLELDTPVTNDEGCVLVNAEADCRPYGGITPFYMQNGLATDTLDENLCAILFASTPHLTQRVHVAVFKLDATYGSIPGQPVPGGGG